jgi:cellulose synthase/poly-beta-1,6-N-acetylglucosamine synthase-like glycosyltransferase
VRIEGSTLSNKVTRISVLVPTYRRPLDLDRCLGAIAAQIRLADRVMVVARTGDSETCRIAAQWQDRLPLEIVEVEMPGQVHALNAGLARCTGDVVAITDDDAAPRPDWLQRIQEHFRADPNVGGVGGRDWVHENGGVVTGEEHRVGEFLWYGRAVGNHHLGFGPARQVDFLKGANCSFRMTAIGRNGFDGRLRGSGAQVHNDLAASLAVQRKGWKIIYDPLVAVDHFPAQRFDEDARDNFDAAAAANRIYNFRLAVISGLPVWRRAPVLLWFRCIGTKASPGLFRLWFMLLKQDRTGLSRYREVRNLLSQKNA